MSKVDQLTQPIKELQEDVNSSHEVQDLKDFETASCAVFTSHASLFSEICCSRPRSSSRENFVTRNFEQLSWPRFMMASHSDTSTRSSWKPRKHDTDWFYLSTCVVQKIPDSGVKPPRKVVS